MPEFKRVESRFIYAVLMALAATTDCFRCWFSLVVRLSERKLFQVSIAACCLLREEHRGRDYGQFTSSRICKFVSWAC